MWQIYVFLSELINAWYNKTYYLIGMPYLPIITSNIKFPSERIDVSGIITYRLPEHTFRTWGLYESQPLVQADSFPTAPTSWETFHNKIKKFMRYVLSLVET